MFNVMDKRLMYIPFLVLAFHAIVLNIIIMANFFFTGVVILVVSFILLTLLFLYLSRNISINESRLNEIVQDVCGTKQFSVENLPVGLITLNKNDEVQWMNDYIYNQLEDVKVGEPINRVFPNIMTTLQTNNIHATESKYDDRNYRIFWDEDHNSLQILDITELRNRDAHLAASRPVIGILFLDNYDEVTQNMSEAIKSELNNLITTSINDWASEHHIYIRRFSQDRFIIVLNHESLTDLEKTRFRILDTVRERTQELGAQITLSIGIGEGSDSFIEVGELAQSSLDLSLGRGGDQVAIKTLNGNARFYGGKTDPMEKRTRVRARVISHALKDILREGSNVIIMGHRNPDTDSLGSAIGVAKIAKINGITPYIILNKDELDETLQRIMKEIDKNEDLLEMFVSSDEAWDYMEPQTTVVVVDTHRPSIVQDPTLLNKATRKVIIDHHRRSDEFISNPLLVYMEPYASSGSELVSELLEYQNSDQKLTRLEATIMLSGIIVDTRNFTLRTGSRTFDAASFLRSNSADPILAQEFLKDDIDTYIARSELIRSVEISEEGIAIVKADPIETYHPVTIAQAADQLLQIDGVKASFVIATREDDSVGISARSLGDVNVQLAMEKMQGGGHLTNAATKLTEMTIEEVYEELVRVINETYFNRSEEE